MSRLQPNIIHHTKNQKVLKLNEKRQSTDANNTEMTELFELSDEDVKAAVIKRFNQQL